MSNKIEQQKQMDISEKSWWTALLLCIFLGYMGAHRYYVRKIGTGIIMCITISLGGFGIIWWFIDLIAIICDKFRDKSGKYLVKNVPERGNRTAGVIKKNKNDMWLVGRYCFCFRLISETERDSYENQKPQLIGRGRTANIVRMDESGVSYEQMTREGIFESSFEDIIADIQTRLSRKSIWKKIVGLVFLIFIAAVTILTLIEEKDKTGVASDITAKIAAILIVVLLLALPFLIIWQNRRMSAHLLYEINPQKENVVREFYEACFNLNESERCWVVTGRERHGDAKHHAGSTVDISRRNLRLIYSPKRVNTNLFSPTIVSDDKTVCFLPDGVLYIDDEINMVSYANIKVTLSTNNFREEDTIPADSEQVDYTWAFVNADGGPDRRFKKNWRIPVLKYCTIKIADNNNFRLELMTSNYEIGESFANTLIGYKNSWGD